MPSIVISRYNENVDWIMNIPERYKIYLYNKGDRNIPKSVLDKVHQYCDLENIGKESDTYLLHMLCNVENDHSFTVFSQGNPFDHSKDFLNLLSHDFPGDVWGYASQWKPNYPPETIIQNYCNRTGHKTRNEIFSLYHWGPIYSFDEGAFHISRLYFENFRVPNGTNIAADFFGRIGHTTIEQKARTATFGEFSYGAIFGVRNKIILNIEKDVYMSALAYVRSINMAGHIMERLWMHFFNHPFIYFSHTESSIM